MCLKRSKTVHNNSQEELLKLDTKKPFLHAPPSSAAPRILTIQVMQKTELIERGPNSRSDSAESQFLLLQAQKMVPEDGSGGFRDSLPHPQDNLKMDVHRSRYNIKRVHQVEPEYYAQRFPVFQLCVMNMWSDLVTCFR